MQVKLRRPAFTLVEILVVIAIIGILASLAAWGVFAMIGGTQRNNTNATIRLLTKLMQQRWDAVVAESRREPPSPAVVMLAGGQAMDPTGERAKVIWTKVRLAEAFPVSYAEIRKSAAPPAPQTLVDTYIPANRQKAHLSKYRSMLQGAPTAMGGTPGESGACLLMALKTLQASDVALDDQIRNAIKDTDGDGLPELTDGWGKPLAFFRFAYNNAALQKANPALGNIGNAAGKKFSDPIDPKGLLMTAPAGGQPGWYNMMLPAPAIPPRLIYEAQFCPGGSAPIAGGSPIMNGVGDAYYVTPVIASAGRDQMMSLLADLSVGGPADNDNIFSFQLRGE